MVTNFLVACEVCGCTIRLRYQVSDVPCSIKFHCPECKTEISGSLQTIWHNGKEGIELEVETVEPERRKKLALVSCSALILRCLEEGLYPSWDAHDMNSVHLAKKFGYQFDHAYTAYEVA